MNKIKLNELLSVIDLTEVVCMFTMDGHTLAWEDVYDHSELYEATRITQDRSGVIIIEVDR